MEKKYLFLLLLLLTVGFASVNTYLDLNGKVDVSLLESDLDVVFKEVLLNKEKSENTIIIENGKSFIYSADELTSENNTSNIDYVVMNKSHQYDVEVTVSCTSDYETYLNYNGTFDNQPLPLDKGILIEAGEVKIGNIITELLETNTSEESLVLKCTLNYIPVSRETIVEDEEYIVTLDSGYEEQIGDIKVKYYEEYSKLPELTRSNYKFLGWYTEEDIKVDNNSLVKIKGNHTLHAKWEKICEYDPGKEWTFDYTGSEQEFTVPCDGNYKIELWGAQGGDTSSGGHGAYVSGKIKLNGDTFFIYVGGSGYNNNGYNGGGTPVFMGYAGGGSTDIRVNSNNLYSRVMVAAGGSGSSFFSNQVWNNGVPGGGLVGYDGLYLNYNCTSHSKPVQKPAGGATQVSGGTAMVCVSGSCLHGIAYAGSFFYGARDNAFNGNGEYGSGGGGSGWYGGGGGTTTNCDITSSASGSSYISGHQGAIGTKSSLKHEYVSSCISSPTLECSKSYSGYVFTDTVMIDGAGYKWTNVKGAYTGMPTHDGTGTMTGNSGNGYAKITYLGN